MCVEIVDLLLRIVYNIINRQNIYFIFFNERVYNLENFLFFLHIPTIGYLL